MSDKDMKLSPGTNDDRYTPGTNGEDDEDFDDEELDEDEDLDDEDDDDDSDEDDDEPDQRRSNRDDRWQGKIDWKKKFYSTTSIQNKKISQLENELKSLRNPQNLSDSDIEKLKEKYNEEDLDVIQKIIKREAQSLIDSNQTNRLAQRELNIFVKEHPDISEPELKHVQYLQKQFWYSLKKAYSVLFGKQDIVQAKAKHRVSDSFGKDSPNRSVVDKAKAKEDKAYADMDAFLG